MTFLSFYITAGNCTRKVELVGFKQGQIHSNHQFSNGLFVVWRSDRFWAGIPSDQVIEQCLMRNLKTSGGLTHGSGMSEEQRNMWTLSMSLCASAHQAIQELTNTTRKSGEQHTEMGPSRISRDWKDTRLVAEFLQERNPFEYGDVLQYCQWYSCTLISQCR